MTINTVQMICDTIQQLGSPEGVSKAKRFFKTGKGTYGEHDLFLGVSVPNIRMVVKEHGTHLTLAEIDSLLQNPYHELRQAALIALVIAVNKKRIAQADATELYLQRISSCINNWDLVDVSAPTIMGPSLVHDEQLRKKLIRSQSLWERRVVMVGLQHHIKQGHSQPALAVAQALLQDSENLIHKAVGWMLREIGEYVDEDILIQFLQNHASSIPAVTWSYATEKLQPTLKASLQALRNIRTPTTKKSS